VLRRGCRCLSTEFYPHTSSLRVGGSLAARAGAVAIAPCPGVRWGSGSRLGKGTGCCVRWCRGLAGSCAPAAGHEAPGTTVSQAEGACGGRHRAAGRPLTPVSLWLQPESPKDAVSAPLNPEPPNPEPSKSPEPVLNGAAVNGLEGPGAGSEAQGDDGQGLSRRRVVRVVRKVVRKVLPGEDAGSAKQPGRDAKSPEPVPPPRKDDTGRPAVPAPPTPPPPPVVPAAPAKPEPKDEISAGLKTLMAKGRTKEHRPRLRPGDRREEKSPEPAGGDAKPSLSPSTKAKPEPPVQPLGGKAEPAKASAPKPTALERHKVPVCARRGML